jgi:hypothetical protein
MPARPRLLIVDSSPWARFFIPEWFLLRLVYPLDPLRAYPRQQGEKHVF